MPATVVVPSLPTPLTPSSGPTWTVHPDGSLSATAAARTDIFIDPAGGAVKLDAATALAPAPDGDLLFSARVTVDFRTDFDAGVLLLWLDDRHWAKLCFEYSPTGQPMVVSVVNREVSDDANAFAVEGDTVWLRISRAGSVWAFHASTDGEFWHMVRMFALDSPAAPRLGFEVQSPTGESCAVTFADITLTPTTLTDARNGS